MSFENRQEDVLNCLELDIGQEYNFNFHQEQGAMIKRVGEDEFELYEAKWSGDFYEGTYTKKTLMKALDIAYEEWT